MFQRSWIVLLSLYATLITSCTLENSATTSSSSSTSSSPAGPGISGFDRSITYTNATARIYGLGFGTNNPSNVIMIGTIQVTNILVWNDTNITMVIPTNAVSGLVRITNSSGTGYVSTSNLNVFNPSKVTNIVISDTAALKISEDGNYLWSCGWNAGDFQSLILTNPAVPAIAGSKLTLGYTFGFAIKGNHAFCAPGSGGVDFVSSAGGLVAVDISSPASPAIAATRTNGSADNNNEVTIDGNTLCVIAYNQVIIYDISTPTSPVWKKTISAPSAQYEWGYATNGYLYAADHNNSGKMDIYDIHTPTSASNIGTVAVGTALAGIGKWGNYVYTIEDTTGSTRKIYAINVSDPAHPTADYNITLTEFSSSRANAFKIVDGYAISTGGYHLAIIDISDPSNMKVVSKVNNVSPLGYTVWDAVVGTQYLYISDSTKINVVRLY